jgi:hypothetical protein
MVNTPPLTPPDSPTGAPAVTSADIASLLAMMAQLSTAMAAQTTASTAVLAEAERRFAATDPTSRPTVTPIAASAPFAVFGGVPVTTRTINDIQMVGRTVISRMERATIIDRDQLEKISKKIRRAITPGFLYIDINKLLESATGSAIVQPIQLLQDLYIELSNSLAETESNEIFYIIETDPTGTITRHTNMITHYVPDLTAQRVIDNTTQLIQRVQASGSVSADAILRTVLNDMVFTTYKILNSIEDPGLRAKVEADLSGHPQNERSGPLAFFYLMQNVCNLEHDQETEVRQALYKVQLLEFPGANVSQFSSFGVSSPVFSLDAVSTSQMVRKPSKGSSRLSSTKISSSMSGHMNAKIQLLTSTLCLLRRFVSSTSTRAPGLSPRRHHPCSTWATPRRNPLSRRIPRVLRLRKHLAHSRLTTQPETRSIASHQDQAKVALVRDTFIPIGVITASAGEAT